MTTQHAMELLMARGWNEYGAEMIIDDLDMDTLTQEELVKIAEDYEDR